MLKTVAYAGYYRHTYLGKINRKKFLEESIEEKLHQGVIVGLKNLEKTLMAKKLAIKT